MKTALDMDLQTGLVSLMHKDGQNTADDSHVRLSSDHSRVGKASTVVQ